MARSRSSPSNPLPPGYAEDLERADGEEACDNRFRPATCDDCPRSRVLAIHAHRLRPVEWHEKSSPPLPCTDAAGGLERGTWRWRRHGVTSSSGNWADSLLPIALSEMSLRHQAPSQRMHFTAR